MIKNIALSGDVGSGKGTISKKLADKLGWQILAAGDFFRQYLKEQKLDLIETLKIPRELDEEIDYGFQDKMQQEDHHIFESHLAGWLARDIPTTFKVLLICDRQIAMQRIAQREGITPKKAEETSWKRSRFLDQKFKKLYDVENCYDPKYFDLVIDTTNITPDEVLQEVLAKIKPLLSGYDKIFVLI